MYVQFRKVIVIFLISTIFVAGQTSLSSTQPTRLITIPTAGILPAGSYQLDLNLYNEGGVSTGVEASLTDRLMIGVSYTASKLIGNQNIEWGVRPEAKIKYRIVDETQKHPAFVIGFNSRGRKGYDDSSNKYKIKAKGAYFCLSRNFKFLGNLGIHGGINYNPIENENDKDPSFFLGFDKSINSEISVLGEYDAGLNSDGDTGKYEFTEGYLNVGVRWRMFEKLHFELDFIDILKNSHLKDSFDREVTLYYVDYF